MIDQFKDKIGILPYILTGIILILVPWININNKYLIIANIPIFSKLY